ncbi:MAG: sulfatase-like hydrolase/transferase [Polyangiales bacterium]
MGWGLIVALCLATPWLTRALLLHEKRLALAPIDLRGGLADASVGLLLVGLVGLLLATRRLWGRVLALALVVVFVFLSFAMYEFISVFDSLYALSHVGFLGDSTFLGGSVRYARHPLMVLSITALAILGAVWARPPASLWWRWWGLAFAASVFGQVVIPTSYTHDEWRERHAIQANLGIYPDSVRPNRVAISAEVRDVFRGNLRGERWVGPLSNRPNVLLIMLEAASGAHLPSVAAAEGVRSKTEMPKLDALARRHVLFTHLVSHQRQTNRGEYGILCGDYPKLLTDQSKMSEQVYAAARRCLPEVLREQGYATAYIQSAPLGFMLKDQFMKKAGFEELIGDPGFERSYARTDWGVDDKAFFEQSLGRVLELHDAERPFFATLLTVGTHHPYTFPDTAAPEGARTRQERAFRWADDALADFLGELEQRGVLDDTVVIITSDESTGLVQAATATQRLLSQSWSFAVVMLPEPVAKRVDTLYAHVDTALSVTDLLGLEHEAEGFVGRSWFRDYGSPRPLFAGNTYARSVMMFEPSGSAVVCSESFLTCSRSVPLAGLPFGPNRESEPAPERARQLLTEVARLSRSGRADMTQAGGIDLLVEERVSVPAADGKKLLIGGQYLRVPGGTTLRVHLDLEVLGEQSTIELHQDVFLDGYVKFERKAFELRGGERWRLSYEIGVPRDASQLVVQLYATTVSGEAASIRFYDARLSMIAGDVTSDDAVVIQDEVSRADPR